MTTLGAKTDDIVTTTDRIVVDRGLMGAVLAVAVGLIGANAVLVWLPGGGEDSELGARLAEQLSMGHEGNFATWFRSVVLALNGLCAYAMWRARDRSRAGNAPLLIAAGFFVISADDVIQFHEFAERMIRALLGWQGQGDDRFAYVGLAFAGVLAVALACHVARFYARTARAENRRWAWSAVLLVGLAMVAEFIYRSLGCAYLSPCYRMEVLAEEGASLAAAVTFLQFQRRELAAASRGSS